MRPNDLPIYLDKDQTDGVCYWDPWNSSSPIMRLIPCSYHLDSPLLQRELACNSAPPSCELHSEVGWMFVLSGRGRNDTHQQQPNSRRRRLARLFHGATINDILASVPRWREPLTPLLLRVSRIKALVPGGCSYAGLLHVSTECASLLFQLIAYVTSVATPCRTPSPVFFGWRRPWIDLIGGSGSGSL